MRVCVCLYIHPHTYINMHMYIYISHIKITKHMTYYTHTGCSAARQSKFPNGSSPRSPPLLPSRPEITLNSRRTSSLISSAVILPTPATSPPPKTSTVPPRPADRRWPPSPPPMLPPVVALEALANRQGHPRLYITSLWWEERKSAP